MGRNSRVGQLSMIAGAMALPSISASDCVAKMTRRVLLPQRLQPFAELAGETVIVEREPALVDDEQRGATIEPVLDAMEQVGQDSRRRACPDQPLGLERLDLCLAEALGLPRRAVAPRVPRPYRAARPASARSTATGPKGP